MNTWLQLNTWLHLQAAQRGATQGGSQAAVDARNSEQDQYQYLREELEGSWCKKLMNQLGEMMEKVPPGSTHPDALFPSLAGSQLSPVSEWGGWEGKGRGRVG